MAHRELTVPPLQQVPESAINRVPSRIEVRSMMTVTYVLPRRVWDHTCSSAPQMVSAGTSTSGELDANPDTATPTAPTPSSVKNRSTVGP